MTQYHGEQFGTFHITTNARNWVPWCTMRGVPEILIDNLVMTRNMHGAEIFAFCILPNHMHILLQPGPKGLSRFMQSFKSQSIGDIQKIIPSNVAESRGFPLRQIKWRKSFYEETIQSPDQWSNTRHYIECNAQKHGIVEHPMEWPWTSLHFVHLLNSAELL